MYLLSLTYGRAWENMRWQDRALRFVLMALLPLPLMMFPAQLGPGIFIDFRAVPLAYLSLLVGGWWGLLGAVPLLLYHFWVGGPGTLTAFLSALGVVLVAALFHRRVDLLAPRLKWRRLWWPLALVFVPNGLFFPLIHGEMLLYLTAYLPLLLFSCLGLWLTVGIIRSRLHLLTLVQTFERQAHQDALSALANRRQFDLDLATLPPDGLLCLIDIDHFKEINDTYGHAVGDEVLSQLGSLLAGGLRASDQAYRYGGEEFAVLFRDTGLADPQMLGERLRLKVLQTTFGALVGRSLTISVGLARRGLGEVASCFERADAALYTAKASGRNAVVVWTPKLAAGVPAPKDQESPL